jgi:hypothetical protein
VRTRAVEGKEARKVGKMKVTRKFKTREEAQAFKDGIEYLNDPSITCIFLNKPNEWYWYVTFYDERKK